MSTLKNFRNSLLGATCAALVATASHAADIVAADAPLESGFNWSGIYVGFGVGAGAVVHGFTQNVLGDSVSFDGFGGEGLFGEVTVGYDHMMTDRLLVGAFADARLGNGEDASFLFSPDTSIDGKYGFDVGLRLGYLVTPNTLGYVSGGYSWQKYELTSDFFETDWNSTGYFAGVGIETVLSGNWTLKSEYRYSSYGSVNPFEALGAPGSLELDASTHAFAVGANYRFGAKNGGGTSFETPAYNWTGFYVGGSVGAGAMVNDDIVIALLPTGFGGEGAFGEISVGYDHEFGGVWVAGIMVDARYSGITSEVTAPSFFDISLDADYGFDVLARIGAKLSDSTLVYAVAGYSWQHLDLNVSAGGVSVFEADAGSSGFSVGGGIESALTDKTAINLEYRYSQYGNEDFGVGVDLGYEPSHHTVRLGAKYKFN